MFIILSDLLAKLKMDPHVHNSEQLISKIKDRPSCSLFWV